MGLAFCHKLSHSGFRLARYFSIHLTGHRSGFMGHSLMTNREFSSLSRRPTAWFSVPGSFKVMYSINHLMFCRKLGHLRSFLADFLFHHDQSRTWCRTMPSALDIQRISMSPFEMGGLCFVEEIVPVFTKLFKCESSASQAGSNTLSHIRENCL